jgi:RNA polymerase sigma-70 factor (ECF subfamily)
MSDETRFRELFDETYSAVVRYAYNRGYRGADAEDLVAATFEVAWRRLEDVPDGEPSLPWLLAVARNLSRNAARRAQREEWLMEPAIEPDDVAAPGAMAERVEARAELLRGLGALKEIDRELILLVARDGLDTTQAGEVLSLKPAAARTRLHRARNQLAGVLGVATVSERRMSASGTSPSTLEERT